MRTLGLVGGIGPDSTIDYYRRLIFALRGIASEDDRPPILICSLDVRRLLRLMEMDDHAGVTVYLLRAIEGLARGGADFALIAANTPHVVFDAVEAATPIPLLSIVRATAQECQVRGLRRVGILGTRFVMGGTFYAAEFAPLGIDVVPPSPAAAAWVHDIYVNELTRGVFRDESRRHLLEIVEAMRSTLRVDGVVLAGTELPVLLGERPEASVALLDTTEIHVRAALAWMRSDSTSARGA